MKAQPERKIKKLGSRGSPELRRGGFSSAFITSTFSQLTCLLYRKERFEHWIMMNFFITVVAMDSTGTRNFSRNISQTFSLENSSCLARTISRKWKRVRITFPLWWICKFASFPLDFLGMSGFKRLLTLKYLAAHTQRENFLRKVSFFFWKLDNI